MITFGAGASSSLSKFDFPFQVQSNISSSSLPRNQFHLPRQFSSPNRRKSELYLSSSNSDLSSPYSSSTEGDSFKQSNIQLQVQTCIWNWKGYSIRYQLAGEDGPALVLIHGFGANSDHWRKNIKVLAESNRVFSIDLIGYGYSDKPNPREFGVNNTFYSFETWATQINDFCIHVVKSEAFFICNSIGGLVGLLAAVLKPDLCKGILLLNISLRMLHIKKQPWYGRPLIRSFQNLLRNTGLGKSFFKTVATADSVRDILRQCYHDDTQVTDELVEAILLPGLEPGAVDVFLEFICYSDGPLPEDLLPQVKCPVLVAWGDKDPWEPVQLGRAYGKFVSVENFVVIPNVGHCPQDEAPHLVNPLIRSFVARHSVDQPTRLSINSLFNLQGMLTL